LNHFIGKSGPEFLAEAMCLPGTNNVTKVAIRRPMPCVVIFVHGVNSEGEWYATAEAEMIAGLNDRLGRTDLLANKYSDDGRQIATYHHSPVIRFFWGYRADLKETSEGRFAYKIPLKRRQEIYDEGPRFPYKYIPYVFSDSGKLTAKNEPGPYYWGGGPFQNGTTALNMAWYGGFNSNLGLGIQAGWFNPLRERPLNTAPKRTYFVNAALRLASLIDTIYASYPNDTIAVVSHSQGTMVALLAMLYAKQVPDTLLLCNSPYCFENKLTDSVAYGGKSPTSRSRTNTFFNVLELFKQSRQNRPSKHSEECRPGTGGLMHVSSSFFPEMPEAIQAEKERIEADTLDLPDGPPKPWVRWTRTVSSEQPVSGVEDHQNHGRVFVYCSPHDRVMGSVPLQSIGWKGVDYALPDPAYTVAEYKKVYPFELYQGVLYQRQFMRAYPVGVAPDTGRPKTPRYPTDGLPYWIPEPSKVARLFVDLAEPDKDATIFVNAPRVPRPVTAEEMRDFDAGYYDPISQTKEFPYIEQLIKQDGRWVEETIRSPMGSRRFTRRETEQEIEIELQKATIDADHSTILEDQVAGLVKRIMAFDLPIGRADCFNAFFFWESLIRQADWLEEGSDRAYEQGGDFSAPMQPPGLDLETEEVLRELIWQENREGCFISEPGKPCWK
jgi:pimeloyl-ACP methyl ester carboxylesterase